MEQDTEGKYQLSQVSSLDALRTIDLEQDYHAILIDMRHDRDDSLQSIHYISQQQNKVALIALCRDHAQLQRYKEVIHHLDDYILADHLVDGELPTRITHAIRRRLKEQELLHEQTRLQSLLDNIPDAIFFKDRESRFTKVNKRMQSVYGKAHPSLLGKTDFDLFSEEHAQAAYNDEQQIIRDGQPIVGKLEKETFEDGHFNWVNTTKVPLKDEQGRIIGTMGISRDITELKKAQDTLAHERSLLKTIIEHALAGIFVKDLAGHYLVVNQRHVKYLGAQAEPEVIGKTLYDFFEQSEATRISATDQKIMQSGQSIENLIDYRQRPDGSELWLLTSKVPLRDELGRCIGLVGISLDMTEQKLAERNLKKAIKTLEETKLQLIEAEKLKTVGRLAAGVAHEVKNPLNVVALGAEYLEGQIEGPEEMLEVIQDMRHAIQKANHVIFELLDYSSPHKVAMELGNINEIISQVLALMRHNFNESCITVHEDLSGQIEPVKLDASKMEQVFINLFLNAISVMKKGGSLTVRTRAEQIKSAGDNVSSKLTECFRIGDTVILVDVLDTGSGLNKEAIQKAFDPFYSTKTTGEGTGLGLSVTRSIIEMHHGVMTLQNRTDTQGACVRIWLPASS